MVNELAYTFLVKSHHGKKQQVLMEKLDSLNWTTNNNKGDITSQHIDITGNVLHHICRFSCVSHLSSLHTSLNC